MHQHIPGAYSEPYQTSVIEPFVKTVTGASRSLFFEKLHLICLQGF